MSKILGKKAYKALVAQIWKKHRFLREIIAEDVKSRKWKNKTLEINITKKED